MSTQAPPRPPRIDPRVRARRAAVKRDQGRRRLRVLILVLVVLVVALGGWVAVHSPLLSVRHFEVSGASLTGADDVRAASGISTGEPIVLVDLTAAVNRIEALPWVKTATVKRDLPSTLNITVTERMAAGWFRAGAGVFLVDSTGRVLQQVEEPPLLPEIVGLESAAPPGDTVTPAAAARVAIAMPPALVTRLAAVHLELVGGAEPSATLELTDGPEVRLGTLDDLAAKGASALAVLGVIQEPLPTYVDVRVPSAPVTG